jgi:hypothetical protein
VADDLSAGRTRLAGPYELGTLPVALMGTYLESWRNSPSRPDKQGQLRQQARKALRFALFAAHPA